eukprot:CAMPEP_0204828716 /NCGR_PEP_ID=MMETSP1346-20131115/6620_1 /ASSEMBLY_ACC=CAM_ASM_000771 /TAXON_ID=215587 /ORGANISM="Aplanochytrium stocchinoi, Strain GSBS06" /LENGTH=209 /DNA_ID=CAMNT_0051957997 /DNA_START=111 /DNA_END=740 /DNA_ORIENTATION=+
MDWMTLGQAKAAAGENPEEAFRKATSLLENVSGRDNIGNSSETHLGIIMCTLCKLSLARYYSCTHQKESAIREYCDAIKLMPTDSGLWQETGKYLEKEGCIDIASHCYQAGSQISDLTSSRVFLGRCSARIKLALYLTYSQGYSKGLELMGKVTKIWPDVGEANFVRGYLHSKLGQDTKAHAYFDKAVVASQDLKVTNNLMKKLAPVKK